MKYLRKFDSVADMTAALASSTISVLGMVMNGNTPVINNKEVIPTPQYTVTASIKPIASYGSVSGAGTFSAGQSATLTATPTEGYEFYRWRRADGTYLYDNPLTFTVTGDEEVRAYFRTAQIRYNVTVINGTPGSEQYVTITGAGQKVQGEAFTLTATYTTPYNACHWFLDGVEVASTDSYEVVNIQGDMEFTVYFDRMATYNVTPYIMDAITGSEADYGTVTGIEEFYIYGDTATLTAVPREGYEFVQWWFESGEEPTTPTVSFTITGNTDAYALFTRIETRYNLTATISPTAAADFCYVNGTGTYVSGENPTLTAYAESPYTFDHWEINGETVATTNQYTVLNIQSDTNATAVFRYIPPAD